jgi:FG-GAP-like repeat
VTRKALRVELRRGRIFTPVFRLPLPAGLGLGVGDVNGDERPDLYVLQGSTGTNTNDLMLLNDGDGTSFTEMSIPVTSEGRAESVEPIDYDENGLTDFLVLNGNGTSDGPVQLIAFFPA